MEEAFGNAMCELLPLSATRGAKICVLPGRWWLEGPIGAGIRLIRAGNWRLFFSICARPGPRQRLASPETIGAPVVNLWEVDGRSAKTTGALGSVWAAPTQGPDAYSTWALQPPCHNFFFHYSLLWWLLWSKVTQPCWRDRTMLSLLYVFSMQKGRALMGKGLVVLLRHIVWDCFCAL